MMSQREKLQAVIGYRFKDESLLIRALTHTSYSNEKKTGHAGSNERLEFLGDAVLELVSSEFFFERYPDYSEGRLTKLRASFVCEPALYSTAEEISLSSYLLLGKGEEATGGRKRPSVVSDTYEALIGAIYLDAGFSEAKRFILDTLLAHAENKLFFFDSKSILQEELQKDSRGEPEYIVVSEEGPDHEKEYTVEVRHEGRVLGTGRDTGKKHAEQKAAYEALKNIGKV